MTAQSLLYLKCRLTTSRLWLTDADAKLMKSKNGFAVAYNPQTAVDSGTHLIRDFEMTNQVTDHGMLNPTMEGIRMVNSSRDPSTGHRKKC